MSTVLVVDDEPAILEVVADLISLMGHEVLRAHNGDEALELAQKHMPELVISDVMMPRRDGLGLLKALREDKSLCDIPVILMSAVKQHGVQGATFVMKPFDLGSLEHLVRDTIGSPRQSALAATTSERTRAVPEPVHGIGDWIAAHIQRPLNTVRVGLTARGRSSAATEIERGGREVNEAAIAATSLVSALDLLSGKVSLRLHNADVAGFVGRVLDDWRRLDREALIDLRPVDGATEAHFDPYWLALALDALILASLTCAGRNERIAIELAVYRTTTEVTLIDHGSDLTDEELAALPEQRSMESWLGSPRALAVYLAAEITRLHGGTFSAKRSGTSVTTSISLPR